MLSNFPRLIYFFLVLILILGIAIFDVITGAETILYPLYFIPLLISGRFLGATWTILIAQFCTMMWPITKILEGMHFSSELIWAINLFSQWVAFTSVAFLINGIQFNYLQEKDSARIDKLTNLLNRRGFIEHADKLIELCNRNCSPLVFAIIDLDNFKMVNDKQGHQRGDEILQIAADTMKAALRKADVLGRLGGDEFVALLPDASNESAGETLERVRQAIESKMVAEKCEVTVSIGAAAYLTPPKDVHTMIVESDSELLTAKKTGKNAVRFLIH